MRRRRLGPILVPPLCALALLSAATTALAAAPAPAWTITVMSGPTNFAPGDHSGQDVYLVSATNSGAAATEPGAITLTDTLPAGLALDESEAFTALRGKDQAGNPRLSCEPGPPISCEDLQANFPIQPGQSINMFVPVDVEADAPPSVSNQVSISGGGAAAASAAVATSISGLPAPFGFLAGANGFDGSVSADDGSALTQAGSHPYQATLDFVFNNDLVNGFDAAAGEPRTVTANLPPGVIVDPEATRERCTEAQLESDLREGGGCPDSSQVGTVRITAGVFGFPGTQTARLYNMVAPPGQPANLGFDALGLGIYVHLRGLVRSGADYGLSATASDILQEGELLGFSATLWGNPSDPSHDAVRGRCFTGGQNPDGALCPVTRTSTALLTLPTKCSGPLPTTIEAQSWQEPGNLVKDSFLSHDNSGSPVGIEGCARLDFSPSITVQPDTAVSDSPSGLHVDLHIPQDDDVNGLATANLRNTVVTLPAGLVVNPSSADGLQGCSSAQIDLEAAAPANCPDAAKIGSVEVDTPLLDHALRGAVYLAAPGENPFHSLLAIYIAVDDPATGVVVKLAGHVEADPQTGRLKTTFAENPQLPFEDFKLHFFGGPRAPLTTPLACGAHLTGTDLTPWSAPEGEDAHPSDSFVIDETPTGGPCPADEAAQPNRPSLEAGTTVPLAGAYSPFVLKLSREDGSQELRALNVTLPPGLSGKLAGVAECSEAQIGAAKAREHEGQGAAEQASPSCPASSEIGTVTVGAGSGTPFYVQGHAYLAGPYKGAPLSMAIVTPALAGPFDLGTVVVRAALHVEPQTAQITVKSDPIPTILDGIPLDLRSLAVNISRNQFTLNPTNCNPLAITATAFAASSTANLTSPFQVGACAALPFKPQLKLGLRGSTRRTGTPAFRALLTMKPGEANIARAQVTLPPSEIVDNAHIGDVCTQKEFEAGNGHGEQCKPSSIYGYARAWSPLLEKPLEGPVYLKTPGHKLPDLLAALNGQIDVALEGKVDSGPTGGLRNTFEVVPDAPVTKFVLEMKGGAKGLLQNSENLCSKPQRARVDFTAQNGKVYDTHPRVVTGCKHNSHPGGRP